MSTFSLRNDTDAFNFAPNPSAFALRILAGGAKSTPITAMQLQTGIEFLDRRRDKFTLKFCERARGVENRYCNEYRCATHILKTQTSPLSHAKHFMKKLPFSANNDSSCTCTGLIHSHY
ncbi:hypothetical protein TNCV_3696251 [Trichonephila clavipes]|nr:hypothetical protein TNCV_3696251 [Trichonephila clavipes]